MSKRPAIDLSALTSEQAAPMAEASQRTAHVAPLEPVAAVPVAQLPSPARRAPVAAVKPQAQTRTEDLKPLAFKVPPAFRKRFRQRAADADLKLNGLLFEALAAWEEKHNL